MKYVNKALPVNLSFIFSSECHPTTKVKRVPRARPLCACPSTEIKACLTYH